MGDRRPRWKERRLVSSDDSTCSCAIRRRLKVGRRCLGSTLPGRCVARRPSDRQSDRTGHRRRAARRLGHSARLVRRARVLATARRSGPAARRGERLRLPPSSLSRRFDRLEEEGWIARHRHVDEADLRAVEVELTRTGRRLWREMNVSYRRAVQALFSVHLTAERHRPTCSGCSTC